jgi:hypothetical protein
LPQENKHKAWLSFQRKLLDVPLNYSKDDLQIFLSHASTHGNELMARLIYDYLELASQSETEVKGRAASERPSSKKSPREMHLFDLLREKKYSLRTRTLRDLRPAPCHTSKRTDSIKCHEATLQHE